MTPRWNGGPERGYLPGTPPRRMSILKGFLTFLAVLVIVATVLPLFRAPYWWVRMFDFPRAQITVFAIVTLLLFGVANIGRAQAGAFEWALFAVLAVCVLYQSFRMMKYTAVWPNETLEATPDAAQSERRLRLMMTNVLMENRKGDLWLSVVREADPDVIIAVETDRWWADTIAALDDEYPHKVEKPQDDTYGMVVRSRLPLSDVEVKHLTEPEVPSIFVKAELPSGERVQLVFLHPRPPRPDIGQGSHLRDAELVKAAGIVQGIDEPVVVAGDMNDVAWSHTTNLFQDVSDLLDPRVGRGFFNTFHADHWWLRYPLDHVFHSDDFALVDMRRLETVGGDHFPMLVELAIDPARRPLQEAPEALGDEQESAAETLDEAQEFKAEESPEERKERIEADV